MDLDIHTIPLPNLLKCFMIFMSDEHVILKFKKGVKRVKKFNVRNKKRIVLYHLYLLLDILWYIIGKPSLQV